MHSVPVGDVDDTDFLDDVDLLGGVPALLTSSDSNG